MFLTFAHSQLGVIFYIPTFPSALASEGPANTDDPVWVVLDAAPLSPFRGGGPCLGPERMYSSLPSPPASTPAPPSEPSELSSYASFSAE